MAPARQGGAEAGPAGLRGLPGGANPPGPAVWHCRHTSGPGSYDETLRRASHEELAVARLLTASGHEVRTVPEGRGGRSPDLMACGVTVEVKSFRSLAERGGRAPSATAVANKLLDARSQGAVAVLWGPTSGLDEATARAGFDLLCQRTLARGPGRLRQARMVGANFDTTFALVPALRALATQRRAQAAAMPVPHV